MIHVSIDDSNLKGLLEGLDPKRLKQALKGGYRNMAQYVRKAAVAQLRSSGIRCNKNLEKSIWLAVWKKKVGFTVAITTRKANKHGKGERGIYTNRRGVSKPVLLFADLGTKERYTASAKKHGKIWNFRKKKGHYTGALVALDFMAKAKAATDGYIRENSRKMIMDSVNRIAKKYGSA